MVSSEPQLASPGEVRRASSPVVTSHRWEKYATVEAHCDGVPVYSLGNLTYIYGVAPDLLPTEGVQRDSDRPARKITPRKSWEIQSNPYGVNICEPGPRTAWTDSQPLLPIHLIDGDPDTAWSSFGSAVPDERPEWIRIDLAVEDTISSVALICNPAFAMGDLYREGMLLDRQEYHQWAARALPHELTIEVSRDAWHWQPVYDDAAFIGDEDGTTVIDFAPCRAKQVRITGRHLRRRLSKFDGYCFSISGVEVRDAHGENLALVSRGAGVVVSSTSYLMDHDRITTQLCFGPVQYDLGLKWVRMGADNGMLTWNYVERTKGRFEIDPVAEAQVEDFHRNGVNIILNLDVKANWSYRGAEYGEIPDPTSYEGGYPITSDYVRRGEKPDWRIARIYELNNIYYDFPGWAWETEDMFDGYLSYVDFMVRRFAGKVAYYEVGNEWGDRRDVYARAVRRIKRNDPDAKIMVCIDRLPNFPRLLDDLMREYSESEMAGLMPDAVGSHPNTRVDAGLELDDLNSFYWDENRRAITAARGLGFTGIFIASEVYSWSLYPPGPMEIDPDRPGLTTTYSTKADAPTFCGESEIVRAKYLAQNFIGHAGLGMLAFQCNTYFVSCPIGQSLFRVPEPAQVLSPIQPDAGYYVLRTICTVMDGWQPAEFPVQLIADHDLQAFTFRRGDERMVAAWIPGNTTDHGQATTTEVHLPGLTARHVAGIDLMNGTEQAMSFGLDDGGVTVSNAVVSDYPFLLRLS